MPIYMPVSLALGVSPEPRKKKVELGCARDLDLKGAG
jgi:hypothetical protein